MALPTLDASALPDTARLPTPYADPSIASPAAMGAGLGAGLEAAGHDLVAAAHQQRVMAAQFDASDRELQYGTMHDQLYRDFDTALKQATTREEIGNLRAQFTQDSLKLRVDTRGTLKDPLAQKMYEVRTRLQAQMAERQADAQVANHLGKLRIEKGQGMIKLLTRQAGSVTGNIEQDLSDFMTRTGLAHERIHEMFQGHAPEYVKAETQKTDAEMAHSALRGFNDPSQALQFLNGQMKDGTWIAFNKARPDDPFILSADERHQYERELRAGRAEKMGAELGEAMYQEYRRNPPKGVGAENWLEGQLAKLHADGKFTGDDIGKARDHFYSILSKQHSREQDERADAYDRAYRFVEKNFQGDLNQAVRESETFKKMWNGLGPQQINLRKAFEKSDPLPEHYKALGEVIDLTAVPGALTRKYPTFVQFQAALQGPAGPLWPQAVKMYERDSQRDTTQDVHYQAFKSQVETDARVVTGWLNWKGTGQRGGWDEADDKQRLIHLWMVASAEQMWAAHEQARKQTPGKESDATWYVDALEKLRKEAKRMKDRGDFNRLVVPPTMNVPKGVTEIKTSPRAPAGAAFYSNSTGKFYDQAGNEVK